MLIRFAVENFRSIAEPVELSMVAIDRERDAAREVPNVGESLLTRAAIYGPNASGKSNVLAALGWLRSAVQESLRLWEDEIPIEPFAFAAWPSATTEFVLDVALDGVRFEYELEVSRNGVQHEALFEYPERRRRRVFERFGQELTFARGLGAVAAARELTTPLTLALSTIRRFEEPRVGRFIREILDFQSLIPQTRRLRSRAYAARFSPYSSTFRLFDPRNGQPAHIDADEGSEYGPHGRQLALELLRMADLGVDDVQVVEEEYRATDGTARVDRRLQLVHRGGDSRLPFEMDVESQGTQTWFRLIGPIVNALERGSLLLIDELDSSLHPTLSAEVLRLFRERSTNPRGAQLVFTAHDTSLLDELNRDEVWLTEKLPTGSTHLGPLSEFAGERVRRSQNLASAYLHGKFGAVPDIDRSEFLRALGLIG